MLAPKAKNGGHEHVDGQHAEIHDRFPLVRPISIGRTRIRPADIGPTFIWVGGAGSKAVRRDGRMIRTGGCQCGQVRYESSGESVALYVCHCRECQKQSASAFGMSLEVPRTGSARDQ